VLGKYRGRTNAGKYLDWKEWVPAEALANWPRKAPGAYQGLVKPPHYWREGRSSLFEHYDRLGMHWSDPDGLGQWRGVWGHLRTVTLDILFQRS
jgi:hypothetical protein